jgi:MFS family permease
MTATDSRLPRSLRFLLFVEGISVLSAMIGRLALAWWIVSEGGPAELALYTGFCAVVAVVAFPLVGGVTDRYRKGNLVAFGVASALIESVSMLAIAQLDHYSFILVSALSMLGILSSAATMPSLQVISAEIATPNRLVDVIGWQRTAQSAGRIGGSVAFGAAVTAGGVPLAFAVQASMLALSLAAALALAAKLPLGPRRSMTKEERWWRSMEEGLKAKWRIPTERYWTILAFLINLLIIPVLGLLIPVRVSSLGLAPLWLALIEVALSIGLLLAALGGARMLSSYLHRGTAFIMAVVLLGLTTAFAGLTSIPHVLTAAYVVIGFCIATIQVLGQSQRTLACPSNYRGRFASSNLMVAEVATICSSALAAALLLGLSKEHYLYILFGFGLVLTGLAFLRVPGFVELIGLPADQVEGLYARKFPAAFVLSASPEPSKKGE